MESNGKNLVKIMDFSDNKLLKNIKKNLPNLEKLLEEIKDHWAEEDLIYRYYHNSFKVYRIQSLTSSILKALNDISPHEDKKIPNESYLNIIADGSGKVWKPSAIIFKYDSLGIILKDN